MPQPPLAKRRLRNPCLILVANSDCSATCCYRCFLRARAISSQQNNLAGFSEAQQLLERALLLQPDYVDVMAKLGAVLVRKAQGFDDTQAADDMRRAEEVIGAALAAQPRNPSALCTRGLISSSLGRYDEAGADFESALREDPGYTNALYGLALNKFKSGMPEAAIAPLQTVLQLDPENPVIGNRLALLGMVLFMVGRNEDAEHYFNMAIAGDVGNARADGSLSKSEYSRLFLIATASVRGDFDEARARYKEYERRWKFRSIWRLQATFTRLLLLFSKKEGLIF